MNRIGTDNMKVKEALTDELMTFALMPEALILPLLS